MAWAHLLAMTVNGARDVEAPAYRPFIGVYHTRRRHAQPPDEARGPMETVVIR